MPDVSAIWSHWHPHPDALIGLAVLQGAYMLGVGPLRERYRLADDVDPRQIATFTLGVLVILASLVSPLHEISDSYLFSGHMVQHVLLTLVAPPLLILGTPPWLMRPLLRPNWAFRGVRIATHPILAFAVFNLVFSIWHIPALYNLSVTNHGVHVFEHLLFMAAATIMWWPLLSPLPELPRLSYPLQMMYLFLISVAQIIVFAPLTFSGEPLYAEYVKAPRLWGIDAMVDQQIGAIIMKMGSGILFVTLIAIAFFKWHNSEQEQTRKELIERAIASAE